ncbi:tyrosine-type recombinase/integrase [Haloferula sp.]|uniref:tyrosine-type recombinase/integrase n=1 Tax=Haloferula sp. TaxID=2497595 RepID=UPI00329F6C43
MSTLYKKPNSPNWYAQFTDEHGDRISRSTGTPKKREAAKVATTLEADAQSRKKSRSHLPQKFAVVIETATREAATGELTLARAEDLIQRLHRIANPGFKVVSLADHLASWIKRQESHVAPNTIRVYQDMERRMIAAIGPKVAQGAVGDVTQANIEKAIAKITSTKVKGTKRKILPATANLDLGCLRRVLSDAVKQGLARANVAEDIKPLPDTGSTERAPFTAIEVRALIDHKDTSDEWGGLILLGAHTGLRLGDITGLSSSNVEDSRLVIRPQKTQRSKKTITIPLTPPALRWIGDREGDFFPTMKGTKTGTLSTQFTRIMAKAEVPRDITGSDGVSKRRSFHSLRHSFTSWLADADIHSDVRQKLTGHSSAGVHGRYTHYDEALERAVDALPSL